MPPVPDEPHRALAALARVSQMVAGDLDLESVLRSAMRAAAEAMQAEACSVLLLNAEKRALDFHIVDGPQTDGLSTVSLPVDDRSIAGWVANHRRTLLVPDAYDDPRFNRDVDAQTGFRTRSVLCVPLVAKGRQLGVVELLNRLDGEAFSEADLEPAGAVASLIAVAIHNAEEHEARLRAERLATIGQTVAGMAHCVKNILNGLRAGSYLIDQNLDEADESYVGRGWKIVKRNMQLLSNIVMDMLSYSKPREPRLLPCRVEDVFDDIVALHQRLADDRGVTLVTRVEVGEVSVDEANIKRCLINLVGNAIDACGEGGGLVELEAEPAGDGRFLMRVRDTGCGMEPGAAEKIFDPFFSTKGGRGTGLGLPVARKIVEEHGGTMRVASEPGRGTEFVLVLPVGPADAPSE